MLCTWQKKALIRVRTLGVKGRVCCFSVQCPILCVSIISWLKSKIATFTMAVPFSRPAYPRSQQRAQQTRSQQQQQQHQRSAGQRIAQFLEGQGGLRLDQLSLTSRIAFYALYEAYRLLQDLTNGQQNNRVSYEQHGEPQQHTVFNTQHQQPQMPDLVLDSTRSADATARTHPQMSSNPRGEVDRNQSSNSFCNGNPTKEHQVRKRSK